MSDLQTLLEESVDHTTAFDPAADLVRGRTALTRRRRRAGVAAALVTAVVAGTGYLAVPHQHVQQLRPAGHPPQATDSTRYFAFPAPPTGWSVWHSSPSYVAIAPDSAPPPVPGQGVTVQGKLLISLEDASTPIDQGPRIAYEGRQFYDIESPGDPRQVSVQDPFGDWVVLQEAPALHWTLQQMVEFLDAVEVSSDAQGTTG